MDADFKPGADVKQVLFFILLLVILGVGYMMGSHGPDPTQWFAPPTPTPTFTATSTFTSTSTATATATATSTSTPTPTPVPKKKARKKPVKKHTKIPLHDVTEDLGDDPTPSPQKPEPPQPPERKPICNAPTLASAVAEVEPNNSSST